MGVPESDVTPETPAEQAGGNSPAPSNQPPVQVAASKSARRLVRTYLIVAVVIVVAVILAAYVLTGGFHSNHTSNAEVLVPIHTVDVIPTYQFDAIDVSVSSTSEINGTFFVTFALVIYTMTPAQVESLARTGVVSGYEWTSGEVQNDSIYTLGVSIPPGAWDLVFYNPSPINNTAIGFYSDLTLTPT